MNKTGFTLIELMVTVLICGFIVLAMTCLFVAALKFYNTISDQANATTDASLGMHSMQRVLRWATPSTTPSTGSGDGYIMRVKVTINTTGNLPEILSNNTTVIFGLKADSNFEYKAGAAAAHVIANDITGFNPSWDSTNNELALQITATKNTRSSSLESKVHLLGE